MKATSYICKGKYYGDLRPFFHQINNKNDKKIQYCSYIFVLKKYNKNEKEEKGRLDKAWHDQSQWWLGTTQLDHAQPLVWLGLCLTETWLGG
jgi:hypothetical protein